MAIAVICDALVVSAGTSGGLTATTSIATTAVMVTITLKPA
jgi:hypothetical protein